MKTVVSVAVIFLAAFAASCFDNDGNAQSGVTRAEFDALLAQVAALEANQPGDKVFAAAGTGAKSLAKATAQGRALGTALTFNGPAAGSSEVTLRSANGYLYSVNLTAADGKAGPTSHSLFYEAAGCAGQPYLSSISAYGGEQGYVFTNGDFSNPAFFYYVPAGTQDSGPKNYNSQSLGAECAPNTGLIPVSFAAQPNDPAITGVESGPIALPITIQ